MFFRDQERYRGVWSRHDPLMTAQGTVLGVCSFLLPPFLIPPGKRDDDQNCGKDDNEAPDAAGHDGYYLSSVRLGRRSVRGCRRAWLNDRTVVLGQSVQHKVLEERSRPMGPIEGSSRLEGLPSSITRMRMGSQNKDALLTLAVQYKLGHVSPTEIRTAPQLP